MGRILAIDFGLKRTGIAVTDPLKISASALTTVPTRELMEFIQKYCLENKDDVYPTFKGTYKQVASLI